MGVGGGRRGREGERKPIHERVEQRARAARMKHQRGFGPGSAVGKVSRLILLFRAKPNPTLR